MDKMRTYTAYRIPRPLWHRLGGDMDLRGDSGGRRNRHFAWLSFAGWVSGWTSATIARAVYPPPRQRKIPESIKWGLAVLTVLSLGVVGAQLVKLTRHPTAA